MQLQGFIAVGVLFLVMGLALTQLEHTYHVLFILLYGLTFFFSNFGPNTTTYVLPAESFPTLVRATCHGISAASGKLGAVIGGASLDPILHAFGTDDVDIVMGLRLVLFVCGGLSMIGALWTWIFTKDQTGKELDAGPSQNQPAADGSEVIRPTPTSTRVEGASQ